MPSLPLPKDLIEEKLGVSRPSVRAIESSTGVNKETVRKILKGELNCQDDKYLALAKHLGIQEETMAACLAWHRLKPSVQSCLVHSLQSAGAFPEAGMTRDKLADAIRWGLGRGVDLEKESGALLVHGEVELVFIFDDEFEFSHAIEDFLLERRSAIQNARAIVFVISESAQSTRRNELDEIAQRSLSGFTGASKFSDAMQTNDSNYIIASPAMVADWIVGNHFNPSGYINYLARTAEILEFGHTYYAKLNLHQFDQTPHPALDFLANWAHGNSTSHILILEGSYGTGKSTLLNWIVHRLFSQPSSDGPFGGLDAAFTGLIPIIAPITKWLTPRHKRPLFQFIVDEHFSKAYYQLLKHNVNATLTFDAFKGISQGQSRFLFLLDGLDEAVRTSSSLKLVFDEIHSMAALGHRIIVATRPEIFRSQTEVREYLSRPDTVRTRLEPLTDDEVIEYIDEVLEENPSCRQAIHTLRQRRDSTEVLRHPLFLNYVCRESEGRLTLFEHNIRDNEHYPLLDFLTDEWFERESHRQNQEELEDLQEFMEELAIEISIRANKYTVSEDLMPLVLRSAFSNVEPILHGDHSVEWWDKAERNARVCSFVTVEYPTGGTREYSFSLRAFSSFFIAERIAKELLAAEWDVETTSIGRIHLQPDDIRMIGSAIRTSPADVKEVKSRLLSIIKETGRSRFCRHWQYRHLGGNAASIYATLNPNEQGQPVLDIDLQSVSLCGFQIDNGIIVGKWKNVDLSEAVVVNTDVSQLKGEFLYCNQTHLTGVSDDWPKDDKRHLPSPDGLVTLPSGAIEPWSNVGVPEGFCFVPPGTFLFGGKRVAVKCAMHGFFFGKTEVTNAEFKAFLADHPEWEKGNWREVVKCAYEASGGTFGSDRHYLKDFDSDKAHRTEPVVYLPKLVMESYADSIKGRLPTEAEWEFAAQGAVRGREGVEDDHLHGGRGERPVSVKQIPEDSTGLVGMFANVREMCADCYWPRLNVAVDFAWTSDLNPYFRPLQSEHNSTAGQISPRKGVVRGTSFRFPNIDPLHSRSDYKLADMDPDVGFRCVLDIHVGLANALSLTTEVSSST